MTTSVSEDLIGQKRVIERRKAAEDSSRPDKSSRVPEDAVRLTEEEALEHQKAVVRDWPTESDVLTLKYGRHIACLSTFGSSFILANYFKNFLNVGNRSLILTFIPSIVLPASFTYMATDKIITNNILLMKKDCPVCHQMKFAAAQLYVGIAFPALYSYFCYASVAMAKRTYPVPKIQTEAKEFWKFTLNTYKQAAGRFHLAGLIQSVLVLFLPFLQNKQFLGIMDKLQRLEMQKEDLSY